MRLGLYFDLRNPPPWARPWPDLYARSLDVIAEAERLGAGAIWVTEHHLFEDGYLPQPLTFLAAVAARTNRVRIGTAVLIAALRPAMQIAEDAAVVDVLSGGRLELGLGAGYRVPEYEAYGADIVHRFSTTDARVREVRRLLDEGGVTPPPVQRPVPMWAGYMGPQGARRAGRLGVGLMSLDARLLDPYRDGLAEGGHDEASARMAGVVSILVADDPDAAWERVAPHLAYQVDSYRRYAVEGTGRPPPRPVDLERARAGGGVVPPLEVLTPADAITRIRARTVGLPVTDVWCWASIANMPDDLVDRHVELLCREVAPALA